jgi:type I restriction enzyme S subunit
VKSTIDVPNGWKRHRLRFAARTNPVKSELDLPLDTEVSFIPMDAVGELGGLDLSQTRMLEEVYNGYTYFADGDVCIAKITPCFENGKGAIAENLTNGVAFGTTELHVLRPLDHLDARFLFYLTLAHDFRSFGEAEMIGAGGQKRVPEDFLKNWRPPLPPLDVQRRIARFLAAKTTRIDALIAKKRALLDRLAEKRQALITRAVTQGLDPDVPRKNSGIDWLNYVPVHWELLPLKRLLLSSTYGVSESLEPDGEVAILRMGNLADGEIDYSDLRFLDGVDESLLLDENDIVFNRTNSLDLVGKTSIFRAGMNIPVSLASYLVRFRFGKRYLSEFANYVMGTNELLALARTLALPSIGQANLNPSRYALILFPVPPAAEQERIVRFLDEQVVELNSLRAQISTSIQYLTEYRAALVTAAVAGQIEDLR